MSRGFFDNMSAQQGLVMGLSWGIAAVSLLALVILMSGEGVHSLGGDNGGRANVNAPTVPTTPPPSTGNFKALPKVTNDDHIRGDKNAEITMIEYSDFQCPFCKRHNPTMDQILADYDGKVRLVFRHFPLNSIHPQAQKAAEASECAGEQGKFWEYHDTLFANQSALDVASLKRYAGQLGLNQGNFDSCLDGGKFASKVTKQTAEAQATGITGTPGTWVNDQLVKGAFPYDHFKSIIDGILAN